MEMLKYALKRILRQNDPIAFNIILTHTAILKPCGFL